MKIGFYKMGLDNEKVRTAFGGMYNDFFNSISKIDGFTAVYLPDMNTVSEVDIVVVPVGSGQDAAAAALMNIFKGPVIIYAPPASLWFRKNWLKRWSHKMLYVYNTDQSLYSKKMYESLDVRYATIPFGSNPEIFKPMDIEKKYDVIFVGNSSSGKGREEYIKKLSERSKEKIWKILLVGAGWEKYGFGEQLIEHGESLNALYNSSKICINISNDEQKQGEHECLDANNRIFDLAMAGCCEISNAPEIIRKYFTEDEVPAKEDPLEWVDLIDMYLSDRDKREKTSKAARNAALSKHAWKNRAQIFTDKINELLPSFGDKKIKHGPGFGLMRHYDRTGMHLLLYKIGLIYKKIIQ